METTRGKIDAFTLLENYYKIANGDAEIQHQVSASRHPTADKYLADRVSGMTCREIAEKYGVTRQAVYQATAKYMESQFREVTPEQCIYPNVRDWMNKNKVSRAELIRRMGMAPAPATSSALGNHLKGTTYPLKQTIDKLLKVTGLTYEQFFYVGEGD